MNYTISHKNWRSDLIDKIKQCANGDSITVHTTAMKTLAERAQKRMCPEKESRWVICNQEN